MEKVGVALMLHAQTGFKLKFGLFLSLCMSLGVCSAAAISFYQSVLKGLFVVVMHYETGVCINHLLHVLNFLFFLECFSN